MPIHSIDLSLLWYRNFCFHFQMLSWNINKRWARWVYSDAGRSDCSSVMLCYAMLYYVMLRCFVHKKRILIGIWTGFTWLLRYDTHVKALSAQYCQWYGRKEDSVAITWLHVYPINMPLCASTGHVLGRCCQHRTSTGPVLATNGMFTKMVADELVWVYSTAVVYYAITVVVRQ